MNLRNLTFRGHSIYYGWVIVTGLAMIIMVSVGMLGVNFGLFIDPISRELGVGQAFFGWAQSGRLLGTAASGFFIGYILDRYGARWLLLIAGLLVGGAMLAMSSISEGWQIVVIFVLMGLIGLQGAGGNLYTTVSISNWFLRKRSKAMSRVFLGVPVGIFIMAPLTAYLIENVGWRDTVIILGLIGGGVVVLVSLIMRRRPEDMGLLMDGDSPGEMEADSLDSSEEEGQHTDSVSTSFEYSWTRAEALRSPAFWKLSIAFGISQFANSTAMLFRVPHFINRGIDPQIVAYSLSFEAIVVFAITFPVGYAAARFKLRYLLILSHLIRVSVILFMFVTTEAWHVFLANALFGISATSQMIVMSVMWPDYFGKANIGSIRGLTLPLITAFAFAGAPLAGMAYDIYGSYQPAWLLSIGLLVISAFLFLVTPKPTPPERAMSYD